LHVRRKTVATLMEYADCPPAPPPTSSADANTSMTTSVYFGRKVAATGAAAVLDALGT
jgi:hypothetical protein